MRIYIDSNTFPATPGLYADAAKTKPIPRMIPVVELQRGGFEVAFVGSNQPQDIASVSLVASIDGAGVQVVAEHGENVSDDSGDAWRFNFALNAESLVAEIAKRGSVRLRVGVIVEDDTERREWQFNTVVYPTASSGEIDAETVESAKNFAELAEQAAKRAQEAQADVAGNAQLAEQAKQTATQAANAAIEAAVIAEVSERNAAESKEAAEQAKEDAEAAKTEAKKAASDAQATLSNVYTKAQIDGVDTGAELTAAMNQAHEQLLSLRGEIPDNFYEVLMILLEEWSLNPTEEWSSFWDELMEAVRLWRENPTGEITFTAENSPYRAKNGVCVEFRNVNFSDVGLGGGQTATLGFFSENVPTVAIFSSPKSVRFAFSAGRSGGVSVVVGSDAKTGFIFQRRYGSSKGRYRLIAPNATGAQTYQFYVCYDVGEAYVDLRRADDIGNIFNLAKNMYKVEGRFDSVKSMPNAFLDTHSLKTARLSFPSLSDGKSAFKNTGLDADSIAYTIDSLPAHNDGKSHVIYFSRADGTLLAPLMAESPYKESVDAAVARGWTVQFDS